MNENPTSPTKLTLADLDRYLAVKIEDPALAGYRQAAAVLSAFDPFELKSSNDPASEKVRDQILGDLLALCEPVTQGVERRLWSLLLPHRRETLRELATRARMKEMLAANLERPDTPEQRMFERMLEPAPLQLDQLSREELAATLEVIDWVEGILDNLPERSRVLQQLKRVDLLAPMQRLAGQGFVGRKNELQQLNDYVFGPKQDVPLYVFGGGGVGKSTLLARFVLLNAALEQVTMAYVDVDRPVILPERPLTVLLEVITQLHPQLGVPPDFVESLLKEITNAVSRYEPGRQLESDQSNYTWVLNLFRNNFGPWLKGGPFLLIVDTLEEAQFMGSDVIWPMMEFLISLNRSLPEARVILSGRALPPEYAQQAFSAVFMKPGENVEDPELLAKIRLPLRPLGVSVLEPAPALKLIRASLNETASATVTDDDLKEVIGLVGGNPMVLKLAGRLLQEEGVDKLRTERSELFAKLKAEKIQALLYGRILRHLHDEDVRKVAYPGLIVRRIAPDVIRDVLAGPCELVLTPQRDELAIFSDLSKEVALVYTDPEDGSLRHRADVRRSMLEDLTDHVRPELVEQINRAAVTFYQPLPGAIARAEELYHLLRLGEPESTLNARWIPDVAKHLQGALEELPPQQRLWLAERLNVTLDPSVRQMASQEEWESQAARSANRYLESRLADKALGVLQERKARSPRSQLYILEAESYRFLKDYDKALTVARAGVEAAGKAGAIDMALDLLLKMVMIEEARGDLAAAETLSREATAICAHSSNDILQLRVKTTGLRLQRQLRPEDPVERQILRQEAAELLNDKMIHKLRDYPILLRESAAELAKQDPRLASAALETLGVEVSTDAQAEAFGNAISHYSQHPEATSGAAVLKGIEDVKNSNDPEVIRKWATQILSRGDTKKLSSTIASAEAGSKILGGFRDYFRAGVSSALKGKGVM